MAAETLSLRQLNRATLARQMLLARRRISVSRAVGALGGLQAQEPKPPHLALWSRLQAYRPEKLTIALRERELVRATSMRATLHLLDATVYAEIRPALRPVMDAALKSGLGARIEQVDLAKVLPAAHELLAERPRAFDELRELLSERFPEMNDRAIGYGIRTQLPLVVVPGDEPWGFPRNPRFALAGEWLGRDLPAEGPLEPLVRRYLAAFGPASPRDFQRWSGLGAAKSAFAGMSDELVSFSGEGGSRLFDLPKAPRPDPGDPAPPRLLPEFEGLLLAHDDRTRIVADEHRKGLVTANLRVRATFLVDGMVAGTWKVERKGKASTIRMTPFSGLAKPERDELAAEAEALLELAEPEASGRAVSFGRPGSHP